MGNRSSSNPHAILENENRRYFVTFKSRRLIGEGVLSYVVFTFTVRFQRYSWDINFRFHDVVKLDRILLREFPQEMSSITRPSKHNKIFFTHDQRFLAVREKLLNKYLQDVLDSVQNDHFLPLRIFMESSCVSFCPDFGRKGKEGWLKKCSGGYHQGFSRKTGDYISVWTWRWFVLVDNCIVWMKNPSDPTVYGSLQLDQSFSVSRTGRVISITNATRRLLLFAQTTRSAEEWELAFRNFFQPSPKLIAQVHRSTYPVRDNCHVNAYTLPRDYYQSLAMALLSAQKEIFIASWKNSPTVLLTRPPLPPIRLDQLLKFKADQGVQIYILLYKEVEHIGQGNDSAGAKKKLEGLSPNIHVIRHPNKFLGGSTALLWSHHEKIVVIDRSSAYVGGIDLAFQRWDDENHRLADEDGILFPGNDYRQPSPGVFKPARNILEEGDADPLFDDGMVEVEVNQEENLPVALSALADDDELYEVQVVVDFNDVGGGAFPTAPSATATNLSPPSTASTSSAPPLNSYGAASAPHSSTHQHPAKQASSPPDDDNASVESASWDEDRDVGTTAEERQALQAQGINVDTSDPNKLMASDSFTSRGSIISSMSSSISASRESIHASLNNISDHFRFYAERAQTALQAYVDEVQTKKRIQKSNLWETRDQYPRMPWHDLQVGVSGRVARDAASHFLQRWNHHRLSTSDYAQPVLYDITDDTLFTVCARCQHSQIIESASTCPRCQYDLGPVNSFSTPESVLYQPIPPSRYSYIVFTCTYSMEKKLPMRMEGDCPVVVTRVLNQQSYGGLLQRTQAVDEFGRPIDTQSLEDAEQNDREGYLVDVCGSEAEWLQAFGLYPARGDVVMEVNGVAVTHLNSHQLKRLISRHRRGLCQLGGEAASSSAPSDALRITFRRHYIEGMQPLDKKEEDDVEGELLPNKADDAIGTAPTVIVSVLGSDAVVAEGSVKVPAAPPAAPVSAAELDSASMLAAKQAAMGVGATAVAPSLHPPAPTVVAASVSSSSPNAVAMSDSDRSTPPLMQRRASTASPTPATPSSAVAKATAKSPAVAAKTAEIFHPICSAAAHRESALSISHFFHDFKRFCEPMPRVIDEQGTCRVQLLRSVGKWSVGTSNVESSIQNAYIECIQQAKHFIYIENQFFVSSTAGSDVQNGVVNALIDRISEAFQNQQVFRVIVIIPMHPNGDFCNALKAKCVMHYEYATINRGMHSMFGRLTRMCPGITISDFVSFYSLRNWGVLNNKVYSEQVYVHDKLLIVDDRVAIIGSANINDRSMLGSRDSEVAVKIEDTLEIETRFNGSVVTVGYMPHMLRLKLMKQHLRDESIDVADIVGNEGYRLWRSIATHNSSVYDELDGQMSFYRCTSITDYRAALQAHLPRSILDSETQQSLSEIRGFIVDWPQQFLIREDLAPSYATRAMIPNELWV